ncbi:2-dehydropantoate 2-reductase [Bordetella sp. 02P26C-1]|uniref:2-dehydropantoate 2-reductase n=1 Tax=Bordetella sp. 02P26C-1 TaxID=2683195 RepID=UPI00135214FB|nr:2-dehydropantoate 2-reductase [Bordetella sp. 02P26C-1]MVW79617.1 2-dehydropantoate 2-reductase [Bordetella sp. 02P26C-1]
MKYCIYGLGAVGGLIGGRLARAGLPVSGLVRGDTLSAVRKRGLKLICDGHEEVARLEVADQPEALGPQDVIFLTVKNTAIASVAENIAALMHERTVVVSAMNGVPWWFYHGLDVSPAYLQRIESIDPGGLVSQAIPAGRVVGCVSNLSASTPQPGTVVYAPNPKFTFGEPTGGAHSDRCAAIMADMKAAGLDVHAAPSIQQTIWFKLWGNMTVNPISAITGATGDRIVDDPLVRDFMARCMNEAREVGERLGISLNAQPEERFEATRRLGAFRTSMLQDVGANKPLELDALVGTVREIASHVGVATPNIDALFGLARLFARTHGLYPQS